MSFLGKFKRSALELKHLRCIVVTGILIALDIVLKMFSIKITADLKITFAFLALASIGMLFGPTVAFISGVITDLIGFMMNPDGGFSPLFTLVEAVGAMIYGLFLYEMKPADLFSGKKEELTKGTVLKNILICLGAGIAAGVLFGFIFWALFSHFAAMTDAEGNTGKIAKVFADNAVVYTAAIAGFMYGVIFSAVIVFKGGKGSDIGKTMRVIMSKVTVVIVCNLIMTPAAMILSGYTTVDSTIAGYPLRLIKNAVQCPIDCLMMLIVLAPILAAYRRQFRAVAAKKTA